MIVKEITDKIENGSAHVLLVDAKTGEVIVKTIWYNTLSQKMLCKKVCKIKVTDYTVTLEVK